MHEPKKRSAEWRTSSPWRAPAKRTTTSGSSKREKCESTWYGAMHQETIGLPFCKRWMKRFMPNPLRANGSSISSGQHCTAISLVPSSAACSTSVWPSHTGSCSWQIAAPRMASSEGARGERQEVDSIMPHSRDGARLRQLKCPWARDGAALQRQANGESALRAHGARP
jgi:hypothetical protein